MPGSKTSGTERKLIVRDIRRHLDRSKISPEKFAIDVRLSHMTIRRWLKRKDTTALPGKYYALLAPILTPGNSITIDPETMFSAGNLMNEIEKSGKDFKDLSKLKIDLTEKLKTARVDRIFIDYCRSLYAALTSPKTSPKSKAIAAGALLYFISPIDLIPDASPVIGYLDDLAVLSLAVHSIGKKGREADREKSNDLLKT